MARYVVQCQQGRDVSPHTVDGCMMVDDDLLQGSPGEPGYLTITKLVIGPPGASWWGVAGHVQTTPAHPNQEEASHCTEAGQHADFVFWCPAWKSPYIRR